MSDDVKPWHLLGAGRVGRTMARILLAESRLGLVWTRSQAGAERFRASFPHEVFTCLDDFTPDSGVVVLTVPDDAMVRVLQVLPAEVRENPDLIWLHTSGVRGAEVLVESGVSGRCGSLHPLQSLSGEASDIAALEGAFFALDGTEPALEMGRWFAGAARGTSARVDSDARAAYHLAAVVAGNGVYGLLQAAHRITQRAGIASDELSHGLATLARHSALSASERGVVEATTGPIVRGDAGTVERHRAWLSENAPELDMLYGALSHELLTVAEARGMAPRDLAAIRNALYGAEG